MNAVINENTTENITQNTAENLINIINEFILNPIHINDITNLDINSDVINNITIQNKFIALINMLKELIINKKIINQEKNILCNIIYYLIQMKNKSYRFEIIFDDFGEFLKTYENSYKIINDALYTDIISQLKIYNTHALYINEQNEYHLLLRPTLERTNAQVFPFLSPVWESTEFNLMINIKNYIQNDFLYRKQYLFLLMSSLADIKHQIIQYELIRYKQIVKYPYDRGIQLLINILRVDFCRISRHINTHMKVIKQMDYQPAKKFILNYNFN